MLFNLAIQTMNPRIVSAILGVRKLNGSFKVVETAVKLGKVSILDLILDDERFCQYIPEAFSIAARQDNVEVLHYLLRNQLSPIAPVYMPELLKDIIVGSIDKNLPGNLRFLSDAFTHDQIKKIINKQAAEYCITKKSWAALGTVMAYQFTEQPVIVPQIVLGLQMILPQLVQIGKMYELGANSSEVSEYLKGFWSTYDVLPADLKCNDWLMTLYANDKPRKDSLLAISDAITPLLTSDTKPEELAKRLNELALDS
jgi:hypothetical protein